MNRIIKQFATPKLPVYGRIIVLCVHKTSDLLKNMDIRTTRHSDGDNRSPTLEKIKKKRREDRQRTTSSGSPKGSQTEVGVALVYFVASIGFANRRDLYQGYQIHHWYP